MHYNKNEKEVKCGGILIDKTRSKILVVLNRLSHLKGENKWGLPKGHRKIREESWKCAQREIMEETSLFLEKSKFNRSVKIFNNIYYIIPLTNEFPKLITHDTKEICEVEWKTLVELRESNFNRDLKCFVNFIQTKPLSVLMNLLPPKKYNLNKKIYKPNQFAIEIKA